MDAIAHFINVLSNTSGYLIFAAVFLIILLWNSIVIVSGSELVVMARRYFGGDMPDSHVIAMPEPFSPTIRTSACVWLRVSMIQKVAASHRTPMQTS